MKYSPESVRLPVDQNGQQVWKTFEGTWLVGIAGGETVLGTSAEGANWSVILAKKSGKYVVYVNRYKKGRSIQIFDTFEEMKAAIPSEVAEEAGREAGIIQRPKYPEEPLDV